MTTTRAHIEVPQQAVEEFCKKHCICKMALFGSALRDDFTPDSDVDVLVEFEPGKGPGFLGFARMERELSAILGGKKVDLRTPHELSRYFRDEVLASAEVHYAQR